MDLCLTLQSPKELHLVIIFLKSQSRKFKLFLPGLHFGMFTFAIANLTNDEQRAKWLPKCLSCSILGTYAQTEMGHGTFIRRLETTSHYDPKTKEFVLHSPTLTSYKWWPGKLKFIN